LPIIHNIRGRHKYVTTDSNPDVPTTPQRAPGWATATMAVSTDVRKSHLGPPPSALAVASAKPWNLLPTYHLILPNNNGGFNP